MAAKAGLQNVIVDLPADGTGWGEAIAELESKGIRYLIAINSLAPVARGIAVEPAGYRITGIKEAQHIDVPMFGATEAFSLVVTQRDGSIQSQALTPIQQDRLQLDVDPQSSLDHVLLIYPRLKELRMPDFWEGFDVQRDLVLGAFRNHKPGPGFRGLVNPLGALLQFPGQDLQFVPDSKLFRIEFENFLRKKYTAVETVKRAWALRASSIESFATMAQLVPLWSPTRGVGRFWDPESNTTLQCDQRNSTAWNDIREVIASAASRRYERLVASLHQEIHAPVVQEWHGWDGPYESGNTLLDGVGMVVRGETPTEQIESACKATSTVLRLRSPSWLLATNIMQSDMNLLSGTLDDLVSLGARGWFVRTSDEKVMQRVGQEINRLERDDSIAQWHPNALFYPELASNPAMPMRLAGGKWWLPSPMPGERLFLGSKFAAYRYLDGSNSFCAIWALHEPVKAKLRLGDPKAVTLSTTDGQEIKPKLGKNFIEVVVPTLPLILHGTAEFAIPEQALAEVSIDFKTLADEAEKQMIPMPEERLRFADSMTAFERSPGVAFEQIFGQLDMLNKNLGLYGWIEAEESRDTNFSEAVVEPGNSGNGILRLRTRLPSPVSGFFANYNFMVRQAGPHELWVAARIPERTPDLLLLRIGDQTLRASGSPINFYGNGYGWYRFGEVSLQPGNIQFGLMVQSNEGVDLSLDVVVLFPGRFKPNGVFAPKAAALKQTLQPEPGPKQQPVKP